MTITKFTARDKVITRYATEAFKLANVSYPRRRRRPARRSK